MNASLRPRALAAAAAALVVVLLPISPLQGQSGSVGVRVLDAGSAEPVVGAVVHLVSSSGATVARGLSNAQGRAILLNVPAGRYRLRAEMIGMASLETEPFEVLADAVVQREMRLEQRAINVEGIDVEVEGRCRVRPAEGLATSRVWEEARKALEATSLTEGQRAYRYRTLMYERDLDKDARTVLGEERRRRVATLRTPFRSRPVAELLEDGFVEEDPEGDIYFAPDAAVLLSDDFLDNHCFRLRQSADPERPGLLGLAFEPLRTRTDVVDIAGTLWVDPETSELRWLDYRYENLDPVKRDDAVGGRVDFRSMPDGGWIVSDWWIRMPSLAVQRDLTGRSQYYVGGFREIGGQVVDIEGLGGGPMEVRTGALEGMVRDSLGEPVEGARVEILGTGRDALTGPDGRYRIDGLVEGTFLVRVENPVLLGYGHQTEPVRVRVRGGRANGHDLRMPSVGEFAAEACSGYEPGPGADQLPRQGIGGGIVIGHVRHEASGQAVAGAVVRLRSNRYEFLREKVVEGEPLPAISQQTFTLETTTDGSGFYRFCRVPEGELLAISIVRERTETPPDTLTIQEVGDVVEHVIEISR